MGARRRGYAPEGLAGPGSAPEGVEEIVVKKLVVLAIAAAVGFLVWKKVQDDRAEQDLWTEATNEFADLR
jgi:hypothetical protein